ncbi:MAG: cysteine-rich CWC family protein [Pseudomonas sp.]|uniref:cysteine-rich CWC family protein n=1 Tax=Pseudomonas sp. TaxID=306 RepID=UPI003395741E
MDSSLCPLCGRANRCAQLQPQVAASPCWCFTARIAPEVLQRVPPDQRDQSCLCPDCAQGIQDKKAGTEAVD